MANLGTIANTSPTRKSAPQSPPCYLRGVVAANEVRHVIGVALPAGGNPGACVRLDSRGSFRFRINVRSGSRTIKVQVKQEANASPRPSLVLKANPDIGIPSDIATSAGSSTGWITVGPVSYAPNADGTLWIELHNNFDATNCACYFDNVETT